MNFVQIMILVMLCMGAFFDFLNMMMRVLSVTRKRYHSIIGIVAEVFYFLGFISGTSAALWTFSYDEWIVVLLTVIAWRSVTLWGIPFCMLKRYPLDLSSCTDEERENLLHTRRDFSRNFKEFIPVIAFHAVIISIWFYFISKVKH